MIPFIQDQLRVEYVKVKSVSSTLQGSMRILDEEATKDAGHEVIKRIVVPFAVARMFKQVNPVSRFLVARDAAVVWYGDQVVQIELRAQTEYKLNWDGTNRWTSKVEQNIRKHIMPRTAKGTWYTDGVYIYKLPDDMDKALEQAEHLTKGGMFRGINVFALGFKHLMDHMLVQEVHTRSLVAIVSKDNSVILTPPIWKNIAQIRSSKISEEEQTEDDGTTARLRFDIVDDLFDVNLEFALNAGRVIGRIFGNKHIRPLRLPELMINLCTVNLPKVQKTVRETYGVGLPFLHAFGWLAGLISRCETMSDYISMRGLMKQLLTKGLFKSDLIKKVHEVKQHGIKPKFLNKNEALASVALSMTPEQIQDYWMRFETTNDRKRTKKNGDTIIQENTIGTIE